MSATTNNPGGDTRVLPLLPCPFCFGPPVHTEGRLMSGITGHVVSCSNCYASTTVSGTPDIAAELWNRRPEHEQLSDILEATYLWNPRYIYYADKHGRTVAAQMEHDKAASPGGCMAPFMLFMGELRQRALRAGVDVFDNEAYDEFIRRFPRLDSYEWREIKRSEWWEQHPEARTAYKYGLHRRPAGLGAVPKGWLQTPGTVRSTALEGADGKETFRWGAIYYKSPLSREEIDQYELIDLGIVTLLPLHPEQGDVDWQEWKEAEMK